MQANKWFYIFITLLTSMLRENTHAIVLIWKVQTGVSKSIEFRQPALLLWSRDRLAICR
jgi:hypothetical protein